MILKEKQKEIIYIIIIVKYVGPDIVIFLRINRNIFDDFLKG